MTTQTLVTRDQRAQSALETVIRSELASPSPKAISVTAQENHSGEPSLYVYVVMPSAQDIPREPGQNRLVVRMIAALEQIEDLRFPYLYFGPQDPSAAADEITPAEDEDA